jgi:hypothetical protein
LPRRDPVPDVRDQIRLLEEFLNNTRDAEGRKPCDARCGIYAYYDFDGAPIYVGQTREQLRVRIRRHLTNKRTDAVAMKVLDPMEVAEIEVWPFWDLDGTSTNDQKIVLNAAEYSVFKMLNEQRGAISNLLNEVLPPPTAIIELPTSYRQSIVPEESRERLYHPDERIARRAGIIAALAHIIKERDVSLGLRRTLVTQADRLLRLAKRRMDQMLGETPPAEAERELYGETDDSEPLE